MCVCVCEMDEIGGIFSAFLSCLKDCVCDRERKTELVYSCGVFSRSLTHSLSLSGLLPRGNSVCGCPLARLSVCIPLNMIFCKAVCCLCVCVCVCVCLLPASVPTRGYSMPSWGSLCVSVCVYVCVCLSVCALPAVLPG